MAVSHLMYTPGPWPEVCKCPCGCGLWCAGPEHEDLKLQNAGDAFLVGAAPELLEALKRVVATQPIRGMIKTSAGAQSLRLICQQAIDKAEGRP